MAEGLGFFCSIGVDAMRTKFVFIAAHASEHAIWFMCRVIGVTRSCYYAWQRAAPGRAECAAWRNSLGAEIEMIFRQSEKRYGAPRIHAEYQDARLSRLEAHGYAGERGASAARPAAGADHHRQPAFPCDRGQSS